MLIGQGYFYISNRIRVIYGTITNNQYRVINLNSNSYWNGGFKKKLLTSFVTANANYSVDVHAKNGSTKDLISYYCSTNENVNIRFIAIGLD